MAQPNNAQQPAVIFIARHGARLDAANPIWHLSTPTPYDPPITYGGWNQSRALGTRIATLLHAREQSYSDPGADSGTEAHADGNERPKKRRRCRHRVVIHSSPFLRCLQTSIAIAAGMAQYKPVIEVDSRQKRPSSASPRLRTAEGSGNVRALPSLAEPKHDLAHAIARKSLHEPKRYRKSKLRVDAFLGEWLNPSYFEGITAPPPSAMMLATAKAELIENEAVEFFRPAAPSKLSTNNNLWVSTNIPPRPGSREGPLDDWSPVEEAMLAPSPSRSRSNSQSSPFGNESGRKSPFRPGSPLQPLTSTLPKQETSIYKPPTPQYAVSTTHQIPQGYVTHARNACVNVDSSWDSSRPPLNWGDGGALGEEWSELHKRIRGGLNSLVQYYSCGEGDGNSNASLVDEQTEQWDIEKDQEDLVVILVTHGAGCNALIGALTGQPVLLDVGMASLTMAVRKDDAPSLELHHTVPGSGRANSPAPPNNYARRGSYDSGLSMIYDMKLVASTEHLRPGADLRRAISSSGKPDASKAARESLPRFREPPESNRSNTNSSLGSIRRPSVISALKLSEDNRHGSANSGRAASNFSTGLWAPPANPSAAYLPLTGPSSNDVPRSQNILSKNAAEKHLSATDGVNQGHTQASSQRPVVSGTDTGERHSGAMGNTVRQEPEVQPGASQNSTQRGLWGGGPSGAAAERRVREPKRRWTVEQNS